MAVDTDGVLWAFLKSQPATTGFSLAAGTANPPAGYNPTQGGAISFRVRGGGPGYAPLLSLSYQFKCYGNGRGGAFITFSALYDTLHDSAGGGIHWASCDGWGIPLQEPDTGWHFFLSFFDVKFLN